MKINCLVLIYIFGLLQGMEHLNKDTKSRMGSWTSQRPGYLAVLVNAILNLLMFLLVECPCLKSCAQSTLIWSPLPSKLGKEILESFHQTIALAVENHPLNNFPISHLQRILTKQARILSLVQYTFLSCYSKCIQTYLDPIIILEILQ